MKVAIYTPVFCGYDQDPYDVSKLQRDNVDFWWFTDKDIGDTGGWMVQVDPFYATNDKYRCAKTNRLYKLQPHKVDILAESDVNVYIDGNKRLFDIDMLLRYCQKLYNDPNLDAIFCRHTERDTVQQEVREVCRLRRDDPARIMRQYKDYRDEGFPDNIPLIVASVQIRKTHTSKLQEMLDCWWNEVLHKSYRDQISMPYAIWKTRFNKYETINVWTERLKMIANSTHKKILCV